MSSNTIQRDYATLVQDLEELIDEWRQTAGVFRILGELTASAGTTDVAAEMTARTYEGVADELDHLLNGDDEGEVA